MFFPEKSRASIPSSIDLVSTSFEAVEASFGVKAEDEAIVMIL